MSGSARRRFDGETCSGGLISGVCVGRGGWSEGGETDTDVAGRSILSYVGDVAGDVLYMSNQTIHI